MAAGCPSRGRGRRGRRHGASRAVPGRWPRASRRRSGRDERVGAREVDVLEDAEARGAAAEGEVRFGATLGGDDDHLAGLDLAQEVGADDVEGAGLGGQDPAVPRRPRTRGRMPRGSRQPTSLVRVMATTEKAPSTLRSASSIRSTSVRPMERAMRCIRHSVSDEDWKIGAALDQLAPERHGVGEVAVVGDSGTTQGELAEERAGRCAGRRAPCHRRSSSGRGPRPARREEIDHLARGELSRT
jgi:hypothetical protein